MALADSLNQTNESTGSVGSMWKLHRNIAIGALVGMVSVYALQLIIAILPRQPVEDGLKKAIVDAWVSGSNYTWDDVGRGNEQFSDAVLLGSFLSDDRPTIARIVNSRLLIRKGNSDYNPAPDLVDFTQGRIAAETEALKTRADRYWYGSRLAPALLLQFLSLPAAKHVLLLCCFLTPFLLPLASEKASSNFRCATWLIALSSVAFGPPLFYGATFAFGVPFAYSMTGASVLAALLTRVDRKDHDTLIEVFVPVYAILGYYFDLLTGGIWFPLWLTFILVTLAASGTSYGRPWRDVLRALYSFVVGVLASVLVKYVVIGFYYRQFTLSDLRGAALNRLGADQSLMFSTICEKLLLGSQWLGAGDVQFGRIVLRAVYVFAAAALFISIVALWRRRDAQARFVCVWSIVAVLGTNGWFIAMKNHTIVHSWFLINWLFLTVAVASISLRLSWVALAGMRAARIPH